MKIAILADSNALPRPMDWGGLPLESTYPYLLERKLREKLYPREDVHLIERGKRYRTTRTVLQDWYEIVDLRNPDVVIVQVGGADCAPRVLLPRERDWLKKIPFGGKLLKLEEKYRRGWLLRFPPRVCVRLEEFRSNLRAIVERARNSETRLIFVNIFDPAPAVLDQFAGADRLIARYNEAIAEIARPHTLIDLHALVRQLGGAGKHTVDGLHLDPVAQEKLADSLFLTLTDQKTMTYIKTDAQTTDITS